MPIFAIDNEIVLRWERVEGIFKVIQLTDSYLTGGLVRRRKSSQTGVRDPLGDREGFQGDSAKVAVTCNVHRSPLKNIMCKGNSYTPLKC